MLNQRWSVVGSGALALALGMGCVQVDAELPTTCFLQSGVSIEALGVDEVRIRAGLDAIGDALPVDLPSVSVEQSFQRDGLDEIPSALDEIGAEASVSLLAIEVVATSGLSSFEGIDRVAITMAPTNANSTLPPTVLARCDRAAGCDTSSDVVTLDGDSSANLVNYLREGELDFTLQLQGVPPLETWSFDVDVCMSGEGAYLFEL